MKVESDSRSSSGSGFGAGSRRNGDKGKEQEQDEVEEEDVVDGGKWDEIFYSCFIIEFVIVFHFIIMTDNRILHLRALLLKIFCSYYCYWHLLFKLTEDDNDEEDEDDDDDDEGEELNAEDIRSLISGRTKQPTISLEEYKGKAGRTGTKGFAADSPGTISTLLKAQNNAIKAVTSGDKVTNKNGGRRDTGGVRDREVEEAGGGEGVLDSSESEEISMDEVFKSLCGGLEFVTKERLLEWDYLKAIMEVCMREDVIWCNVMWYDVMWCAVCVVFRVTVGIRKYAKGSW